VGPEFDIEACNYDKIIIHDRCVLQMALTIPVSTTDIFYRYMEKTLFEGLENIFTMPPLYKLIKGIGKKEKIAYACDRMMNLYG